MINKKDFKVVNDLADVLCNIANEHLDEDEKIVWNPKVTDLEVDAKYNRRGIIFNRSCNLGLGELVIWKSDDGTWHYDSETMGEEFSKLVINRWTETIFEKGVCED